MWPKIFILTILVVALVKTEYKYETKYFEVPLDHFGYQRSERFQIKYLVNDDYWNTQNGPIFFYTGNEGDIELFAKHMGFMWESAQEFNAKIVFAEHRYYGSSMPFGNKSLDREHIGYLTIEQALADYADLVDFLQDHSVKPKYPVITFGGSYGGMLAAYFRMKYPHLVTGAIAASAPVHIFPGMTPCGAAPHIITASFEAEGRSCKDNIKQSWKIIRDFTNATNNNAWLKSKWNLCDPVENGSDVGVLIAFLVSMYFNLAMVNYPFPSDFLMPLPANPVKVVCQTLNETFTNNTLLLERIGTVLDLFTNYDKKSKCVDYKKGGYYGNLDGDGWENQACTEIVMPMCMNGHDLDMFEASPWNYTQFSESCYKRFGVYPQPDAARIAYGGDILTAASNIVFSNGLRDPLAAAGILRNISESVEAVVVPDGAHHLDLMASHPSDPPSVTFARSFHKQRIHKWIGQFHSVPH